LRLGLRKPKAGSAALSFRSAEGAPSIAPTPVRASPAPVAKPAGSLLPRFHATAGDQVDPRASRHEATLRIKLRSAFTPSQPITDQKMFAGRREILTTLIRSIEDERLHVILYGERGIGKTSLLHVLAQAGREARYLVVYVSCGSSSSFDETFRTVASEIPLMFHRDFGPTSSDAEHGAMFASLLDETPVSVRQASDLCAKVADTRVLVILDEFDRCESQEFRRDIAEFLKNLSDRSVRVQLAIAGVAANLAELIQHRPTINRNIFAVEAPRMTPEEIRDLVGKGESASGLVFDEAAREMVVSVANGMPYSASLLSQHAGLAALSEGRTSVDDDDVSAALAEAMLEIHGRLTRRAQFQLRTLVRDGAHKLLGPIAGIAQFSGGCFTRDDIDQALASTEARAKCAELVDRFAAERFLLESVSDEFGQHFRFVDESVPAYLWFLTSQSRFIALGARTDPAQLTSAASRA
jgi:Cdc6-like AAA superfamily ATPase